MKIGYLLIIVGPSGVGKTTIVNSLLREIPLLKRIVSYTTRPKRKNEVSGKDYYFVSEKEMNKLMKGDKNLRETANKVYGYTYALSFKELKDIFSGKTNGIIELVIDKAIEWKQKMGEKAVIIFLFPPFLSLIKRRLKKREEGRKIEFRKRLQNLEYEAQIPTLPKYRRFIDHIITLPEDLEEAKKSVVKLVKKILQDNPS